MEEEEFLDSKEYEEEGGSEGGNEHSDAAEKQERKTQSLMHQQRVLINIKLLILSIWMQQKKNLIKNVA